MGILTEREGDLLDNTVIAHGCNCQGVMGSGVAAIIKHEYPDAFAKYMELHDKLPYGAYQGQLLGLNSYAPQIDGGIVVNMFTQEHYGRENYKYVSYDAIVDCFREAALYLPSIGHNMLHVPRIGCGLANGKWPIVREIIQETIRESKLSVTSWTL